MKLFLSAGEPSGDLHLSHLARQLRALAPDVELTGFGGPLSRNAGVALQYELANLAVMGFSGIAKHLPEFFRLARRSEIYFRREHPAGVVLIDYPGFHFALAKRAHRVGVPVYFYVPPQLWAWRGGRVKKVRKWFRAVLTALPFEETWYRERGVRTHYVGHPYFDELSVRKVDHTWVARQRSLGGPIVALLPGSRTAEVHANYPLMLQAAQRIHRSIPGTRFLTAAYKESHARIATEMNRNICLPIEVYTNKMPEILDASDIVLAVSGSVSLELLYHLKPSVIVYRVSRLVGNLVAPLLTVKYMSLVNLLAERPIYPEFPTMRDNPEEIAAPLIRWLTYPQERKAIVSDLSQLRAQVAIPGAARRAAEFLVDDLQSMAQPN